MRKLRYIDQLHNLFKVEQHRALSSQDPTLHQYTILPPGCRSVLLQ